MLLGGNVQGNARQNHNEVSPHTCQDGCKLKKQKTPSVAAEAGQLEPPCPAAGTVKRCSHHRKQYGGSSKITDRAAVGSGTATSGYTCKKQLTSGPKRGICTPVVTAADFSSQEVGAKRTDVRDGRISDNDLHTQGIVCHSASKVKGALPNATQPA